MTALSYLLLLVFASFVTHTVCVCDLTLPYIHYNALNNNIQLVKYTIYLAYMRYSLFVCFLGSIVS